MDASGGIVTDGCTAGPLSDWLNGIIEGCCDVHDVAYSKVISIADKVIADMALGLCAAQHGHPWAALLVVAGVTVGGWFFINWWRKK